MRYIRATPEQARRKIAMMCEYIHELGDALELAVQLSELGFSLSVSG